MKSQWPARDQPVVVSLGRSERRANLMANSSTRISAKRKKYGIACKNIRPAQHPVERARRCRQPATDAEARVPHQEGEWTVAGADQDDGPRKGLDQQRGRPAPGYWDTSVPKLKWKISLRYET